MRSPGRNKILRITVRLMAFVFVMMNIVAAFHAYKFTHFADPDVTKTGDPKKLSTAKKLSALFLGISNPRPVNNTTPDTTFTTLTISSNRKIVCWQIQAPQSKGTVVLFHGYAGKKSSMLGKARIFRHLGYSTLLADFMGSGDSEGSQTTIGFKEAQQVISCFEHLSRNGEKNIILFGTSMGAAAIMKAVSDAGITPKAIIVECPFGTMYKTVCARFRIMNAPPFPMAGLLVFWGGIGNGFWAFGHNPETYAQNIHCPALLLHGAKDDRVSMEEISTIFANLKGPKKMKVYPDAAHENYLNKYEKEWTKDIATFTAELK